MPLYEFMCERCGKTGEHFFSIEKRDTIVYCTCHLADDKVRLQEMKRLPGGHKMLYFEEGRQRVHYALGQKPISSHGEHKKRMKEHGVVECNNELPPRMKAKGITPKKEQMREITAANKGRWY